MCFLSVRNLLFAACVGVLVSCIAAALPAYIDKCTPGDQQCILKNINTIFSSKFQGDESFGLTKLDPVNIGVISLKQDANNPVNIELTLSNPLAYGGQNAYATKVKGFGKSPEGQHDILVKVPKLSIVSDYKANGKVLILPVYGQGKSNFTFVNAQLKISIHGTARNENGAVYMDVKDVDIDIIPQRFIMQLENLFNGDKALGDNVNVFLNENWREIYEDLKPAVMKAIKKPFMENSQRVFKKVPYSELFEL